MKIATTIEQSKKLAEMLPIDSADMMWLVTSTPRLHVLQGESITNYDRWENYPAWSLSALLDVLPDEVVDNHYLTLDKEGKEYCCCYEDCNGNSLRHCFSDNPVNACYEMILKLKEKNLI